MAKAARTAAAAALSLAVVGSATGWFYVLRPLDSLPGPRVQDALALDELSKHGSAPLVLFLAVWTTAAILLGGLARSAGAERLTAGLLLGPAVGAWLYLQNGVSILVVRQVSAHLAFHVAAAEQSLAIPAVLTGIAGALLGRPRTSGRPRGRFVLAMLVAGVGVLAVVNAVFPEHRESLIPAIDPSHAHGLTKGLIAPLAAALVVTARSLARGSRRGWQVAIALLALLVALHVERRFDEGAIVTGVVLVALIARRADFQLPGDPSSRPRLAVQAALAAGFIAVYGLVTIWFNRLMADRPYSFGFALRVTGRALAGMSFTGANHLSGPVAEWFPLSVFLLGAGSSAAILLQWLGPWRYRLRRGAHELDVVRSLVTSFGSDTLAPFALRSDKSYFFADDESAFLAYRVIGGVAIVAGDPIGRAESREQLVRSFIDFAHARSWRVAVLGVSERDLALYRSLGLRALYHGDEAVVDTASFSLEGRPIRKVRQSVHRLEHAGYTARVMRASEVGTAVRSKLEAIALEWRGDAPERGFVMAFDALFRDTDDDAVFVVGLDLDGEPRGFLHFAACPAGSALSLSSMPRSDVVPNGFIEWLICEAIAWARNNGFASVSLNFSPFAALLSPDAELSVGRRLQAATLRRMKPWFQFDNLLLFNRKFFPVWQRRFLVYERRIDLPRVGVAALAVEAYLPFQ